MITRSEDRPLLSVIIAARNDADRIDACLTSLRTEKRPFEIIVVDGESEDGTIRVAGSFPEVKIITAPACRGLQFNRGAKLARGRILLFLQAGVRLEQNWYDDIATFETSKRKVGTFRPKTDAHGPGMALLTAFLVFRSLVLRFPFGDQGLFTRRETYHQSGGFNEWPRLEDLEMFRGLRKYGGLFVGKARAALPADSWKTDGFLKRTFFNIGVFILYKSGVSPSRLSHLYADQSPVLNILTRFPGPGMSMDQLSPAIGRAAAAEIHQQLLRTAYDAARCIGHDVCVYHPREHQGYWFHELLAPTVLCRPQASGDEGRKLECIFRDSVNSRRPVLILKSNCPGMTSQLVRDAVEALRRHDAVIGGTPDGDLYLIGLTKLVPGLLDRLGGETGGITERLVRRLDKYSYRTYRLPDCGLIRDEQSLHDALADPLLDEGLEARITEALSNRRDGVIDSAAPAGADPSLLV